MISNREPITDVLSAIKTAYDIDSVYSHFTNGHTYPFLAYIGNGQSQLMADGTAYWRGNTYQVELYFKKKDESLEEDIEDAFLAGGWNFSKSEDVYISDEGVFYITYQLS